MLMSMLIWILTRAKLCLAKNAELNSEIVGLDPVELDIVEEESVDDDDDEDEY